MAKRSEFTPGDWTADDVYIVGGDGREGFRPGGEVIAQASPTVSGQKMLRAYPYEERRANAHLFAAAKDLYEALSQVIADPTLALSRPVTHLVFNEGEEPYEVEETGHPWWSRARAALAKARGEQEEPR